MTYEPYQPGTTMRTAVGGGHHGAPGPSRSTGRTVGVAVSSLIAVVGVVGFAAASHDDDVTPPADRWSTCAAEHDETSSLFSDAEWCDLELNGGDGGGVDPQDPLGGIEDEYGGYGGFGGDYGGLGEYEYP